MLSCPVYLFHTQKTFYMCACVFKCITVRVVSPSESFLPRSLALWLPRAPRYCSARARSALLPVQSSCVVKPAASADDTDSCSISVSCCGVRMPSTAPAPTARQADRQTVLTRVRCPCRGRRQRRGASRWRAQLITKIQNAAAFGGGQRVCVPLGSTTVPLPPAYWEALHGTVEVTLPSCNRAIPCDRYQNLLLSVARGTWQAERLRWRS